MHAETHQYSAYLNSYVIYILNILYTIYCMYIVMYCVHYVYCILSIIYILNLIQDEQGDCEVDLTPSCTHTLSYRIKGEGGVESGRDGNQ